MGATETLVDLPAFRVRRGDQVRHDNRRCVVLHVEQVVFYSRNRNRPLAESERNGIRLTVQPCKGTRRPTVVTFRNFDTVRSYR